MDLQKLLNLLERIEYEVSGLYKKLREDFILNKDAADFFFALHLEEESHVQFIRMERRIIQSAPRVFKNVSVDLSGINSLLESIANLKVSKLDLPALLGRIYAVENSPAVKYLIDVLKDTSENLRELSTQLRSNFDIHAEKIAAFAGKIGVKIEEIENRFIRKARVGYGEKVLINSSETAKAVDISEGGMFLVTGQTYHAGDALSVQFQVPDVSIRAGAVVKFMVDSVGIGIKFTDIRQDDQETISQYVKRRIEEKGIDKQKRLLLVGNAREDGRDVRSYVSELINSGYKVVDLAGFEETVASLRRGMDLSCIILTIESDTDPNYYLLRFIPTLERYKNVPVVVVAKTQQKELRETLLNWPMAKMLVKKKTSPKRIVTEVNNVIA